LPAKRREIKSVAKSDRALAAKGCVLLMERLWPALEGIDTNRQHAMAPDRRARKRFDPAFSVRIHATLSCWPPRSLDELRSPFGIG
jgi:hypothetical protein